MKKGLKLLLSLTVILTLATSLIACNSKSSSKTTGEDAKVTVRLNEVTRSVFYGPMYVAISQGFFDKEGITIDLATGHACDIQMQ
ncbi:ABC transporter substrate-binding protein [Clostridium botulinum]|nr:ABC transporter substrate-binding protein [Clostridium botulinum]